MTIAYEITIPVMPAPAVLRQPRAIQATYWRKPPTPVPEFREVLRWSQEWPNYTDLDRTFERVVGRYEVRVA